MRYSFCLPMNGRGWSTELKLLLVRAGIGVWLSQIEIHFVSSLAWERFGQHKMRFIFMFSLFDGFAQQKLRYNFVFAGLEAVWSTCVKINFVSSLTI